MLRQIASRFRRHVPTPASRARFRPTMDALETREVRSTVPLHVAGTTLQDPSNNTVVLRGVDIASLEWRPDGPTVLKATDAALSWGANLIRLPVNEDFWFGHDESWTGGEAGDGGDSYRALVDQVINKALANNAYVMLDMHWSDMGVWGQNNGQHDMPDDNTTAFWQDAAQRYSNNPAVLFDPYNEPTFGGGWQPTASDFEVWRDGGMISTDEFSGKAVTPYHSPGMQGLVNTIRETGALNVIAAEGLNWGSNLNGVVLGYGLSDPAGNLMYQSHLYPNKKAAPDVLSSLEQVAKQYPIYIGEWAEGSADANRAMIDWMAQQGYSWTAWAFSPDFESDFNLITDWDTMNPTDAFGVPVKEALSAQVVNQAPSVVNGAAVSTSPVVGTTAGLSVLGADDHGESKLTYTWTTTGATPAPVTFSANGTNASKKVTATFSKSGTYTFLATIRDEGGLTATSTVSVQVNVLAVPATTARQINAGGAASGTFAADAGFSGGMTSKTTAAIDTSKAAGPAPASVYKSERYGDFSYREAGLVAGAPYTVRLHFAEIYWDAAGQRTFNVSANGTRLLTNFDIIAAAGAKNRAVVREFTVKADVNGAITLTFQSVVNYAKISGLEFAPIPASALRQAVNAGGSPVGTFGTDAGFTGGSTSTTTATIDTSRVTSAAPDTLYQSERYGNFTYRTSGLTAGASYTVRLYFAEIYWDKAGQRTFNVSANGTRLLTNFDIVAAAGAKNRAVIREFTVKADASGGITLAFQSVVNYAKLSGLEVVRV